MTESPGGAVPAGAGETGTVTVNSVVTRSETAQTPWKGRKRDVQGLGTSLAMGTWVMEDRAPSPHPPLTPVGAEPGAETRKALDAISQRLSRVPGQLSVRRAWSSGCFVCLCVGCRGRVGCDGVKEAKELHFHLLHGRRV